MHPSGVPRLSLRFPWAIAVVLPVLTLLAAPIAATPVRAQTNALSLADDWYVDIGDCAARTGIDRSVVFRYGQRIDDPALKALACSGTTLESLTAETRGIDLGRGLRAPLRW